MRRPGSLGPVLLVFLRIARGPRSAANMAARRSMSPNMPPTTGAARRPAGSSRRRRSGCWRRCWSSSPRAAALGEEAFGQWGWRIPFLMSVGPARDFGVDADQAGRKPALRQAAGRGRGPKTPLREAFGQPESLKQVAIAFFGIMCAQGAVWYFTFFYMQVFLEKSLGVPGDDQGHAADHHDGGERAALCLFRLAQRPGRPQAGDAGRDVAGAGALFPRLAPDRPGRQPGAGRGAAKRCR